MRTGVRTSPEDLHEVTRKIRPDWDRSAPGLRENWEGDKKLHKKITMIVQKKVLVGVIGIEHVVVTVMVGVTG